MKIAIIGAGISGLTAAYRLSPWHDITVFEANDYLGDALKLVQFATQYPGATAEFPGLEERLNEISNDISCGANRGIDCGPEACDVMGQISLITQQLRYIKRDNL